MMKLIALIIPLLLLFKASFSQQDGQFSQYIFNNIHLNPAYGGYKEDIYLQSFYRSQWAGLEGAPKTLSFAVDGATKNNKVGLSLLLNNDKIGAQSNLSAYIGYAYRINTSYDETSKLSFGMSLGFMQSRLDGKLLIGDESGDNYIPAGRQSSLLPDARAGILYTSDFFFAGLSANNIIASTLAGNDTDIKEITPKPHLYFTAGSIISLGDEFKIKPVVLLKDDLGGPTNLDINTFLLIQEKVWIGAMYRTAVNLYPKEHLQKELFKGSATGLMLEVFVKKDLRIGYSFDYSTNKLKSYNNGTHEISIGFYLKGNSKSVQSNGCYF